jgi:hypothetical protein
MKTCTMHENRDISLVLDIVYIADEVSSRYPRYTSIERTCLLRFDEGICDGHEGNQPNAECIVVIVFETPHDDSDDLEHIKGMDDLEGI